MRFVTLIVFGLLASRVAGAQVSDRLDPARVDMRWDGIPWGGSAADVETYLDKSLAARSRALVTAAHGQHEKDTIRKHNEEARKAFHDSAVAFTGQKTGYNLSVLNNDFAHDTKESMAVLTCGKSTDYFFFMDGKLWKLITTDASKAPLSPLLVELTAQYGAPSGITYADSETKTEPLTARWSTQVLTAETEIRPDYATRLIRWTWRAIGDQITTLRGGKQPPGLGHEDAIDPAILDIMSP